MKVGWLHDPNAYLGGAEMTCREFRAAGPDEITGCPPRGGVEPGCDVYVANNVVTYRREDLERIGDAPLVWYHHDLSPWIRPDIREWLDPRARHVFCSPLQRDRYGAEGECIPPPIDLGAFRPQTHRHRRGNVSIAQWRNPGKGAQQLVEWAAANGPVDVWGDGEMAPAGENIRFHGPVAPEQVAGVLYDYETFVFLPVEFEPFGRCVAEAWASGCELIVNRNIGAAWWIENNPEAIDTAADDFWRLVEETA